MSVELAPDSLIRRAVSEVVSLPEEDLPLVIELASRLKRRRWIRHRSQVKELVARARQRAAALADVPHDQLVAQLIAIGDTIRADAIANGTAIEGEWEGD